MGRVNFRTALVAAAISTLLSITSVRGEQDIPLPGYKKLRPLSSDDELLKPSNTSDELVGPKIYHKRFPKKLAVTLKAATWVDFNNHRPSYLYHTFYLELHNGYVIGDDEPIEWYKTYLIAGKYYAERFQLFQDWGSE